MSEACKLCRGACCESILVPIVPDKLNLDFWSTRGRTVTINELTFVELENRCKHLVSCGSCGIYPNRPKACEVFDVGSSACLHAIKSRRPYQSDAIIALIK